MFASGTLTIANSTISRNFARAGGGAFTSGNTTIVNSTIDHNNALGFRSGGSGGGLFTSGSLTMINSTISDNNTSYAPASGAGGGLYSAGITTITASTIDSNRAGLGANLGVDDSGRLVARNTLVGNPQESNLSQNCAGSITSEGNNLEFPGTSCGFTAVGDVHADPHLGPLGDNGGPTATHILLAGSAAIDAGATTGCPVTDQRGGARPLDGNGDGSSVCDIGAVEVFQAGFVSCTPRPRVSIVTRRASGNSLEVTVTANDSNNRVVSLRFDELRNAMLDLPNQLPGASSPFTYRPSPSPQQLVFTVRRVASDKPVHVTMAVFDGCNEWRTFVGGGLRAFD